ncbi:hypothetical protein UPYG_G00240730 [Umbra pygmaea]|uniref:DBB domain-containing protein n=1 Tax=Umbra pygmaea TaxID=75934 RepID=A0ABD0WXI2_UMBPY
MSQQRDRLSQPDTCKMSSEAQDLLIIYEPEAEQWAVYMRSVFAGSIPETRICCYDVSTVTSRRQDFLRLGQYKVKLLILTKGMLDGMCQLRRFFLARILTPATSVVVLLCGVDSLEPLLEIVPFGGDECLQISSEQDAQDYLSAVTDIVHKGHPSTAGSIDELPRNLSRPELKVKVENRQSVRSSSTKVKNMLVVPSRVPCGTPGEVFIFFKDTVAGEDVEVEFNMSKQRVRVKPVQWNAHTFCVKAADFPTGSVVVTLYCSGAVMGKASLQYYTIIEEISRLLTAVTNPVNFMCQAFQVSSVEKLDQKLSSMLLNAMPSTGFQGIQEDEIPPRELHLDEVPSLLHFAAKNGLMDVSTILLQCPGARRALSTANCQGQTPAEMAQLHGHAELHVLLQQSMNIFTVENDSEDTSIYEMMSTAGTPSTPDRQTEEQGLGEEEGNDMEGTDELYAPLGINDDKYDAISSSSCATVANRPPAPTPRPENLPVKEDSTPFIAQVFQKKKTRGNTETLYSSPTRQTHGRDSESSVYDTFVPRQPARMEQLIELQEGVKSGSLSIDEAMERFSDWQMVQKGVDSLQQDDVQQLNETLTNNREDDESVYDKINKVHHTPKVAVNESQKGSQAAETEFYSMPLKGQNKYSFRNADKR